MAEGAVTGRHLAASLAQDVAAQALGTVVGAGLTYVGAAWLGMIGQARRGTVLLVLLLTAVPLGLALAVRRRHARHLADGGMRDALLREIAGRVAAGETLEPHDARLLAALLTRGYAAAGSAAPVTSPAGSTPP
jgi:hypothetical protein